MMARSVVILWLCFCCGFLTIVDTEAEEIVVSAVTETDQEWHTYYWWRGYVVKNWVHTGRPGLIMTEEFNKTGNSTFQVMQGGLYYVTANLILATKSRQYSWGYYWSTAVSLSGAVTVRRGSTGSTVKFSTAVKMKQNNQKNVRVSGYVDLKPGEKIEVRVRYGSGWERIVKAGSTLSIMQVSRAAMFPGVMLKSNYDYLHLENNSQVTVTSWHELNGEKASGISEGSFMVPRNGLYHVLVTLNFDHYDNPPNITCSILINNETAVVTRAKQVETSDSVILEGVYNLMEHERISVIVKSAEDTYLSITSSSTFFVYSKGQLSRLTPGISTEYNSSSTLPANTWSTLNRWDTTFKKYGNVELQHGEFVSPKPGIYQITFALYLSTCNKASVRLSIKTESAYEAIGPDASFDKEKNDCYFENTLLLNMDINDTLRIQVKSDKKYTVTKQTTLQIIFQNSYSLWPAAVLQLENSFQFKANATAVKVHDWSHMPEGNWNNVFFDASKDDIQVGIPGLYLISYSLVVQPKVAGGQFESQVTVNNEQVVDSTCRRGEAKTLFTCSVSTLVNLKGTNNLGVQVKMTDKSRPTVEILTSSKLTITFIGDPRSHPAFKLLHKTSNTYTTKAGVTKIKSLNNFTVPDTSYFQSNAFHSTQAKSFKTGANNAYVLLNNVQMNMKDDGIIATVVGSKDNNMMGFSQDHKKSHFTLFGSDLSYNADFYYNISATALKSDLKWQPENTVSSGLFIGNAKRHLTALKANVKTNTKSICSPNWALIDSNKWNLLLHANELGKITPKGIQMSKTGFYVTSLNLAMKSNNSKTVVHVGIFVDQEMKLTAIEANPEGTFSMFLQGLLDLKSQQDIDVKMKCTTPSVITFAKAGGMFAFRVDETQVYPGMRIEYSEDYDYSGRTETVRTFSPSYYAPSAEDFIQDIEYSGVYGESYASVERSGVYMVALVGYNNNNAEDVHISFTSNSSSSPSSPCTFYESPLHFSDTTSTRKKTIASHAFVSLSKGDTVSLEGNFSHDYYHYRYSYSLSVQFMADLDTSSVVITTLQEDATFKVGQNQQFKSDKSLTYDHACHTSSSNVQFGKHKATYTGYYIVLLHLVVRHSDSCDFGFCFTIDGKVIDNISDGLQTGCFNHHLPSVNVASVSTVHGSELLYLKAGEELSVQFGTSLDITLTSRSGFSAFYLGTSGTITGFSSIVLKPDQRELPSVSDQVYRWHYSHYHSNNIQYVVKGWQSDIPNSKIFFQNGVDHPVEDTFVSPQDGIYMFIVKLRVMGKPEQYDDCAVKLALAVDSNVLSFSDTKSFVGPETTLSFTTTLRLKRWQGVTVIFAHNAVGCKGVKLGAGSTFVATFLSSGEKAFTLWPNIGPHIIEFPSSSDIYIREDKPGSPLLTCRAVGKYPISYQWKAYINYETETVVSDTNILDTRTLNSSSRSVQCFATMNGFVAESTYTRIHVIDPTVIFTDTYDNRTYDVPEKNGTNSDGVLDILEFGARMKKPGRYYYDWRKKINCSITGGNIDNAFMVVSTNQFWGYGDDDEFFKLRARIGKLDRETTSKYDIEITCENLRYDDAANATTTIHVDILDSNDNLPVFEKEIYNAIIPKSKLPGEDLIQVRANDDDAAQNGKITYSLVYSSDSYIFVIDRDIGVISLGRHERLSRPYYRLTAIATDQGNPPRSAYVTVVFEVQDFVKEFNHTNKHPVFERRSYSAYLIQGTRIGTTVVTVDAHDPNTYEHRGIRYWIVNGDISVFRVDPKSGVIKTVGKVTKEKYILDIGARYINKPKETEDYNLTTVFVTVRDVDTSKPNFLKQHYEATVPENASKNTKLLTVAVKYKGKVKYSLPANRRIFSIDKDEGIISLASELDYEHAQEHTFVVSAQDIEDDTRSSCTDVTIHVKDVNDNSPEIYDFPNDTIVLSQHGGRRKIGRVKASDKDNGTNGEIKYYLRSDYGIFSIDPNTGNIYVDGEQTNCDMILVVEVEAKDQGIPSRSANVTINIALPHCPSPPPPSLPIPSHPHAHSGGSSDSKRKYVIPAIAGVAAILVILLVISLVVFWRRRRNRLRNDRTMRYVPLPPDEEDDALLDVTGSDNENEEERRLSLVSAASDDNLLRNEAPC